MTIPDSDRPLVLAHKRFAANREDFRDLDIRQRFQRIHDINLWGAETSSSGLGSEAAATTTLRNELPALLTRLRANSLLDAPCGDATWINTVHLGVSYFGLDIVPAIVQNLQARAATGDIRGTYTIADITRDELPRCDVILCRDCLVHLSFENIERAVSNFRLSGAEWLITTTFPLWQINRDCEDGDWRALNLEHAPFSWPAPLHLLNENCTEAGGGWKDKSLGVWRLAELPHHV